MRGCRSSVRGISATVGSVLIGGLGIRAFFKVDMCTLSDSGLGFRVWGGGEQTPVETNRRESKSKQPVQTTRNCGVKALSSDL